MCRRFGHIIMNETLHCKLGLEKSNLLHVANQRRSASMSYYSSKTIAFSFMYLLCYEFEGFFLLFYRVFVV